MLMETSEPDKKKLAQLTRDISELQKQLLEKHLDFELAAKKIAPEYKPYGHHGYWSKRGSNWGGWCPRRGNDY